MARTDENGREVQAVLGYMLNRAVPAKDIYGALGIARNTYHNREKEDSYPNAEECRLLAQYFDLNPLDLLVRFGLITEEHLAPFTAGPVATRKAASAPTEQRLPKFSDMPRNPNVSSL